MSIRRSRHRVGIAICASIAMSCASVTMLWAATETPRPAGPPVPPTTHSTRIILLGTGAGPIPRKLRSQPASLLIVDGIPYLIDVGNWVARQLVSVGFEPTTQLVRSALDFLSVSVRIFSSEIPMLPLEGRFEAHDIAAHDGLHVRLLTHLSPGLDTETDASRYTDGVRKYFISGTVIAGRDLLEF